MTAMLVLALMNPGPAQGAQAAEVWNPGPGHVQVNLWSGKIPSALAPKAPESLVHVTDKPVGGKPWMIINDVLVPTMTVYQPSANPSGTSVIVYPGGGYNLLAIDLVGTEICEWLNSVGITAILVKYRVPTPKVGRYRESLQALQDAQRAISLVRSKSAELGIAPNKIGVMGFSAGGHLVAAVSTGFKKRSYPRLDAVDDVSCRPDFAVPVYPGHITTWSPENDPSSPKAKDLTINPNITVTAETPPTFLVQAEDDDVDDARNSLGYFLALKDAKVPAELHMFSRGGHAFGLRKGSMPIGEWPNLLVRWLKFMKFT
jgi:acetyl esterase/lipase